MSDRCEIPHCTRPGVRTAGDAKLRCCAPCADAERELQESRSPRWHRTHPDYTELAAADLGLVYERASAAERDRIARRALELVGAAKAAGTYADPDARRADRLTHLAQQRKAS